MKKYFPFLVLISILFTNSTVFTQTEEEIAITNIKSNLEFLSNDLLKGRETGTEGEKLAALYISRELQKYGIKPGGDSGTYFQNIEFTRTGVGLETKVTVQSDSSSWEFKNGEDMVMFSRALPGEEFNHKSSELVFAGYGITAEEYDFDEYDGLDVKGKTVIVFMGEPYSESEEFFNGKKDTKYSRLGSKLKLAQKNGAVGMIVIPSERILSYWGMIKRFSTRKSYKLPGDEEKSSKSAIPQFVLSIDAFAKVFAGEETEFNEIRAEVSEHGIPMGFALKKSIRFDYTIESDKIPGVNVVGILEGNDEELRDEYVAMSAHFDHLGEGNGDVFNGADDDGSGTVAVLETARKLAESDDNDRSIVFVFHTGEEKGLLGSKYFTSHSELIPHIVADVNLDMVGRENADSIHCIGSGKLSSEFYNIVREANEESVNFYLDYTFDAPDDPNRFYYRSDHYEYAQKGIPIVFFFDNMKKDYHKVSDEVDKINFRKINKISNLSHDIVLEVANLDHRLIVDKKEQ